MAKRRSDDVLLHDPPSKRCYGPVRSADGPLGAMAPPAGTRPPSPPLLALLGSRSRKRPRCLEDPEEPREAAPDRKPPAEQQQQQQPPPPTSGSFPEPRSSGGPIAVTKKRARENSVGSEPAAPEKNDEAEEDPDAEDCAFNSFQYWRPPLPELDLSLLDDASDVSPTEKKTKVKNSSSSDAMET